jgi:hypothetical protein
MELPKTKEYQSREEWTEKYKNNDKW